MNINFNIPMGIRYTLEILMACNLFVIPMKKRPPAMARILGGMCAELLIGFLIEKLFVVAPSNPLFYLFWAIYVVLAVPYVWFVCEATRIDAVYSVVFGFAIQHLSSELLAIFEILPATKSFSGGLYLPVFIGIYVLAYFLVVRRLVEYGTLNIIRKRVVVPATLVLFLTLILSVSKKTLFNDGNVRLAIICQIYDILCCVFILWMQVVQKDALRWQKEADYIDYLWHSQRHAYELTHESIDIINRKCHDLRHQIAALRASGNEEAKKAYIKEIEDNVMIYDASIDTGNQVLNTVLMEKMLYCNEHGIAFTCIADASALGFIDVFDLYALFGNALDNAVESVGKITDPDRKAISLKVATREHFILIQTENYMADSVAFENGLPVTTKANNGQHGYGIKSIRVIAEKYGGCIKIDTTDDTFTLQILIPMRF